MRRNRYLAAGLSIFPGLGQIYVGQFKRGLALAVIGAGAASVALFSRSRVVALLAAFIYLVAMLPAGIEAWISAKTGGVPGPLAPRSYVAFLLLTTGFSALPLLWQDARFSRRAKVLWTVAVPVLAVFFFGAIALWGAALERWLRRF